MAESVFRGPAYSAGAMIDGRVEPFDGPGLEYQANGFPDIRFTPTRKDGMYSGRVRSLLNSPFFVCCDNIPQAVSTTGLAAGQAVTAATPMTLVTVQPNGTSGIANAAYGVSILRSDTNALVSGLIAIDFGFATGSPTAASATLPVNDGTLFYVGQWIVVAGAGNAAKTLPLYTQVTAISGNNLTVSPVPAGGGITNVPIGSANPPQTGLAPVGFAPNTAFPFLTGGLGIFLNPPEALARCVSITGNAGSTAQNFTVRGYDTYLFPMTEIIAFAGGATTKFGQKAFKFVASITPATTDAGHTLSAGWGDTFGLHARSDKWEYTNLFYNGAFQTSSAGWLAADKTNPATGSTGDTRGTLQVSANGNGSAIAVPAATDGTKRLMMALTVPLYNNLFGTPINTTPLYGQAQFAG